MSSSSLNLIIIAHLLYHATSHTPFPMQTMHHPLVPPPILTNPTPPTTSPYRPQDLHQNITSQLRTRTHCSSSSGFPESDEPYLQDLRVPLEWVTSPAAAHEAEWLRGALQQWLDDEYCPEPANEEISRRCAQVYYYCLMEKQMDIGDILMQMVRDLETFSFKESFHGAFSSANAAIALITKRIGTLEGTDLQ
ncbi:unnamed protein product [Sphagnum jensenii]|uniref:Uncharacterized protein n=2 Tax=Sphagnum jensenii TaxID=128206 RepID=A0ABP1AAJ5_9BRYO